MVKFPPSPMALRWLGHRGKGIEIGGALWNPFHLDALNVAPADDEDRAMYDAYGVEKMGTGPTRIDVYAEGDDLPFADSSYPWLLASHVLEHMPDPLRAMLEWHRVVRPGGVVYVVVPHRGSHQPDLERPVSDPMGIAVAHSEKWRPDAAMATRAAAYNETVRGHHWVWDEALFRSLLAMCFLKDCRYHVLEFLAKDDKVGNGYAFALGVIKGRNECGSRSR